MLRKEFDDVDIFNLLISYGGDVNFHAKLVSMHFLFQIYYIINNIIN